MERIGWDLGMVCYVEFCVVNSHRRTKGGRDGERKRDIETNRPRRYFM